MVTAHQQQRRLPLARSAAVWLCMLLIAALAPRSAQAQDPQASESITLFERGLGEARREAWHEAASSFERSCALVERPSTVFNLILAYDKLKKPLSVLRMVQRFMKISDPVRHVAERRQLLEVEARVYGQLARVEPVLHPVESTILVDNEAPVLANDARTLVLAPGRWELAIQAPGYVPQVRLVDAEAGAVLPLDVRLSRVVAPRSLSALSVARPPEVAREHAPATVWREDAPITSPRRRTAARALVLTGAFVWLAAVAADAVAVYRAERLSQRDPEVEGYLTTSERYVQARRAVAPLAWSGGALMTAGSLTYGRESWTAPRAVGWSVFVTGVTLAALGTALWIPRPDLVGQSPLSEPRREHGMTLTAIALPALVWGARQLWNM